MICNFSCTTTYFARTQEHGAAFEAGGLEVGQLILEVDGNKVEGMHHQVLAIYHIT